MRGLTVIAGGKYTTYRVMAKDAVDFAVHDLERRIPASITEDVPLHRRRRLPRAVELAPPDRRPHRAAAGHGRAPARPVRLADQRAVRAGRRAARPAEPLPGAPEYLRVEALYAATHEGARHLEDVLTRRTRISIETPDRGVDAAPAVAELIAPVLGWDADTVARELEHYAQRVAAERESQHQRDDLTADSARLGAPDVRMGAEPSPPRDSRFAVPRRLESLVGRTTIRCGGRRSGR